MAQTIETEIEIDAPTERVWDAFSDWDCLELSILVLNFIKSKTESEPLVFPKPLVGKM